MNHPSDLSAHFAPLTGDRLEIRTLRSIFAISEDDVDAMKVAWRLVEPVFPALIVDFYGHPFVASHFTRVEPVRIDALATKQLDHFRCLFNSNFDEDYLCRVRRAAIAHRVLGIRASTYIAAYRILIGLILQELRQGFSLRGDVLERLTAAISKIVAADVAITVQAYECDLLGE